MTTLPRVVFGSVLSNLGPKDIARASAVCKKWRADASHDAVWHAHVPKDLWKEHTGKLKELYQRLNTNSPYHFLNFAHTRSLSFCFDEEHLYAGNRMYHKTTGAFVRTFGNVLSEEDNSIYSSCVDEQHFCTTRWSTGVVYLYDKKTGTCTRTLDSHTPYQITHICSDKEQIYIMRGDFVQIQNKTTNVFFTILLQGSCENIFVDAEHLYIGSFEGGVHMFDKITGVFVRSFTTSSRAYSIYADNRYLYVGDATHPNPCLQFDKATGALVRSLEGHHGWVGAICDDGNNHLFTASNDFTIKMWKKDTGRLIRTFNSPRMVRKMHFEAGRLYTGDLMVSVYDLTAPYALIWEELAGMLMKVPSYDERSCSTLKERVQMMPKTEYNAVFVGTTPETPQQIALAIRYYLHPKLKEFLPQKERFFGALYEVMKPWDNDYFGCAEEAFWGRGNHPSVDPHLSAALARIT